MKQKKEKLIERLWSEEFTSAKDYSDLCKLQKLQQTLLAVVKRADDLTLKTIENNLDYEMEVIAEV